MTRTKQVKLLEELQREIFEIARANGWHDRELLFPVAIAMIHSEASEALEAHRKGHSTATVAEELADIVIRVLDLAEEKNLDVVNAIFDKCEKNKQRTYRHGGLPY